MSPVNCLSSVARAPAALCPLLVLLIAVALSPYPAHAKDRKPVAAEDVARATAGEWTTLNVLSNDYDPDGTKVRIKKVKQPQLGKAKVKKNKKLKYKPNQSAKGQDVIRYVIRDRKGKGKKAKGRVVVQVQGPTPSLAELCDDPGVLVCDGFETGGEWSFYNESDRGGSPALNFDSQNVYEGGGALEIAMNSDAGADMGGSVAYDHQKVSSGTAYYHFQVKWEEGYFAWLKSLASGKGPKLAQWVAGTKSCNSTTEINIVNTAYRNVWGMTSRCDGRPFRIPLSSSDPIVNGDFNIQPIETDLPTEGYPQGKCTWRHFTNSNPAYEAHLRPNPANCGSYVDGVWNQVEVAATIGGGVTLWVNGVKVIDYPTADGAGSISGYFSRLFLTGYNTTHASESKGIKRFWIDNLVISTECITSCGQ